MKGIHFKLANAVSARVRLISLLFSFMALSFVAAADTAQALRSNVSTNPNAAGDWVQADFDATHSGFNRLETEINPGNVANLTQLWASPVGTGALEASPVVWNGKVYIGSGDGRMYAFDAATGATLWVGPQQDLFFVDSAAVGHGLVFASSVYSTFLAYDAQTGAIAWTSPLTDVRASPTLRGGTLYVGSFDGRLVALDAKTGTPIWFARGNCCIFDQAPVVDGGRVFQIRTDGTLTAYDAQTGAQLWSKAEFSVGTPAAAHGMLFFNHYPNVVALDGATGAQLWAAPVLTRAVSGAPAVANGTVFVTSTILTALQAATGEIVWDAPASSNWGPSVANGVVYASGFGGEWAAFDEHDGSLLWSVITGGGCGFSCTNAVPVIANGTLYLAGPDQYLRAFALPTEGKHTGLAIKQEK